MLNSKCVCDKYTTIVQNKEKGFLGNLQNKYNFCFVSWTV